MVKSTSASLAMANKCNTALVDPPIDKTKRIAFSNASLVIISLGFTPRSSIEYMYLPASWATSRLRLSTAGIEAAPGIDIPIASIAEAIVLAVNIPEQAPSPGHAALSISMSSSILI